MCTCTYDLIVQGLQWLVEDDEHLSHRLTEHYDFGMRLSGFEDDRAKFWTNPMAIQLPHAPNMRIVCYYGVGKPTERAYTYKLDSDGKVRHATHPWQPSVDRDCVLCPCLIPRRRHSASRATDLRFSW